MPLEKIDVVILAGGRGTRLAGVVADRPKPMAEVCGKPFLFWILKHLTQQGLNRIIISTGYMADYIQQHFIKNPFSETELIFCREEQPLGTGGGLRNTLSLLKTDPVLVLNGDSYCQFSMEEILQTYKNSAAKILLGLVEISDCSRYGLVEVDPSGKIVQFSEKTAEVKQGWINAGVYLLERALIQSIPFNQSLSLERDFFPSFINKGLFGIKVQGPFIDIGTPESYILAQSIFQEGLPAK